MADIYEQGVEQPGYLEKMGLLYGSLTIKFEGIACTTVLTSSFVKDI
jgi:hypothetical protein